MTTGNNNNYNPYGQYGNGEVPSPTEVELNQQAAGQPTTDYGQQTGSGQAYTGGYTGAQTAAETGAQGYPGYGTSQPQYGNTSTPDYTQYNSQTGSSPYATPGYGYGQQSVNYQAYGATGANQPKGLAIASLVLGIVGFIFSWIAFGGIFALVGVVLGIVALMKTKTGGGGKGFAIAGIALGAISLVISVIVLVFFGWIFSIAGNCSQYANDDIRFNQCINEQLGVESSYSSYNSQNS